MAEGDLPKLGGRARDIARAHQARISKPLPRPPNPGASGPRPLSNLVRAERTIGRLGKSQVARILKFAGPLIRTAGPTVAKIGAVAGPVGAVAGTLWTAKQVYDAAKEGHKAYGAYKDLERTRETMKERYGSIQRANAERRARTKRR